MLKFINVEAILENLKIWHLILGVVVVFFTSTVLTLTVLFGAPKYFNYIEEVKMHRTVEWAETNAKVGMIIGPSLKEYPDLNDYLKNNSK